MDKVLFSIIVPVYKAKDYLDRCVSSLIGQTYTNIEIILVDDGSPDECPQLCDVYAKRDARIKVIHKINGGLSSARNAGINIATGDYILFCDSDDYFDIDTCKELYNIVSNNDIDLVIFSLNYINGKYINPTFINLKEKCYDKRFIESELIPNYINLTKDDKYLIQPYSVNKLYKVSILNEYNIRFDESRRFWEDKPFVVAYLNYCNDFYFSNKTFYNYVSVEGSLSRKTNIDVFRIIEENHMLYKDLFASKYNFENINVINYYYNLVKLKLIEIFQQNNISYKDAKSLIKRDNILYWIKNNESTDIFDILIKNIQSSSLIVLILVLEANLIKIFNIINKILIRLKNTVRIFLR